MKAVAMAGNAAVPGTSVLSRGLAVLTSFDARHHAQTLSEIASRASLPVATAHRMVGELEQWGALVRRADNKYVIGRRIWDLGLLAPIQTLSLIHI